MLCSEYLAEILGVLKDIFFTPSYFSFTVVSMYYVDLKIPLIWNLKRPLTQLKVKKKKKKKRDLQGTWIRSLVQALRVVAKNPNQTKQKTLGS